MKGQVNIFIVLGIVLSIGIGIALFSQKQTSPALELPRDIDANPVGKFITQCLQNQLEQSIRAIASQGGYYSPYFFTARDDVPITFYVKDGIDASPQLDEVSTGVARHLEDNIGTCFDDFASLGQLGYAINALQPSVKIEMDDGFVFATLEMPIEVVHRNSRFRLERFEAKTQSSLGKLYGASKEILYLSQMDPQFLPLDALIEYGLDNNLTIELDQRSDFVIYSVLDEPPSAPSEFEDEVDSDGANVGDELTYSFAIEYGWNDE